MVNMNRERKLILLGYATKTAQLRERDRKYLSNYRGNMEEPGLDDVEESGMTRAQFKRQMRKDKPLIVGKKVIAGATLLPAAIGALSGAAVGEKSKRPGRGAAIGALVGGLAGLPLSIGMASSDATNRRLAAEYPDMSMGEIIRRTKVRSPIV